MRVKDADNFAEVPIVTKSEFQCFNLGARVAKGIKGYSINTGGTSGQPLEFKLDSGCYALEWAHMHSIWMARGYRPHHLKLTFRGKHYDKKLSIRYNSVHHEYVVNANANMDDVVNAVLNLPMHIVIRWIHGYPSLVSEFAHCVSKLDSNKCERVRGRLYGVLLGSEYPAEVYRNVIENVLSSNIVSWYGHSEMSILAKEISKGIYQSLPSYGIAEAVPIGQGNLCKLVCTSLHNKSHPFVRYDTGDLIELISDECGVLTFRIAEGRVGDFIVDADGQRHSLTAIIFGRHHMAFQFLRHLQVRQESTGVVTLIITPKDPSVEEEYLLKGFDLSDLNIEWLVEKVENPVRTSVGKIRLKVS